jgi:tetratricopeptide (TPR) repeat protein
LSELPLQFLPGRNSLAAQEFRPRLSKGKESPVAWFRRCVLIAAIVCVTSVRLGAADPPTDSVLTELDVQVTLQQAREMLRQGRSAEAVAALESRLSLIRGRADYLLLLHEAYTALLRDAKLNNQKKQADQIQQKLARLEPILRDARIDGRDNGHRSPARRNVDPFQQTPLIDDVADSRELLLQAVKAFDDGRYQEAGRLFAQVHAREPELLGARKADWAYCRIAGVVDRLKAGNIANSSEWDALDAELQQAIALAEQKPELAAFGRQVRQRLHDGTTPVVFADPVPAGWTATRSEHFRVIHRMPDAEAKKLLQLLEKSRVTAIERWANGSFPTWRVPCDVFIHPTGTDYQRSTGKDPRGWGHATVEVVDRQVVRRRIDFPGDELDYLTAGIPREVTHLVLADLFPDPLLPRWADEAVAILSMPRPYIERYLRVLPRLYRERQLIAWDRLLTYPDYPPAESVTAFYVQSVSLCEVLLAEKGVRQFMAFLQQMQRHGVERALRDCYGFRSFAALQDYWEKRAFDNP